MHYPETRGVSAKKVTVMAKKSAVGVYTNY